MTGPATGGVEPPGPDGVGFAASAVAGGSLVILPTDTVYGLGCRPDDPHATAKVFQAKRRRRDLELPVLCATIAEAAGIGVFDDRARTLAGACWPGGLTLVLPRAAASHDWDLGGDPGTVGVRIPAHPLASALLAATGPLAVTSANRSGDPPVATCEEAVAVFGDLVAAYLCDDGTPGGRASTVVDLAHGPARVLRSGAVGMRTLRRFLPGEDPLLDSAPS